MEVIDVYKNMGLEESYLENGGIGFGTITEELLDADTYIFKDAYEIINQIRKSTDETGIERYFALFGEFIASDDGQNIVITKIEVDDSENINDGKAHKSEKFIENIKKLSGNYNCIIMCHTHPSKDKINQDLTSFYEIKEQIKEQLKLREPGFNISNADIKNTINDDQSGIDSDKLILQGISLPNKEFNIFGIKDKKIMYIPRINKVYDNGIVPLENYWTNKEATKEKNS